MYRLLSRKPFADYCLGSHLLTTRRRFHTVIPAIAVVRVEIKHYKNLIKKSKCFSSYWCILLVEVLLEVKVLFSSSRVQDIGLFL